MSTDRIDIEEAKKNTKEIIIEFPGIMKNYPKYKESIETVLQELDNKDKDMENQKRYTEEVEEERLKYSNKASKLKAEVEELEKELNEENNRCSIFAVVNNDLKEKIEELKKELGKALGELRWYVEWKQALIDKSNEVIKNKLNRIHEIEKEYPNLDFEYEIDLEYHTLLNEIEFLQKQLDFTTKGEQ